MVGGAAQLADFLARQRQNRARLEELAVELLDLASRWRGEAALVHRLPKLADHRAEAWRILLAALQNALERLLWQQLDILREHREEAAHQEHRDVFRLMAAAPPALRDGGKPLGDIARHPRRLAAPGRARADRPDAASRSRTSGRRRSSR